MSGRLGSWLAATAIAIAYLPHSAAGQDDKRFKSGVAELLAGGDWTIGFWQGNILHQGTSSGTTGLTRRPRVLVVERNGAETASCRWLGQGENTATARCQLRKDGIDLVTASGTAIEFFRSGPDSLQGIVTWKGPYAGSGTGTGTQAFMNRLTATSEFGWAAGLWRGNLEGFSFGNTSMRTLRIVANGARPICYWAIGERQNEPTQGCLISSTQISLVTSGSALVDLQRQGNGLRGTFRFDDGSYDAAFQRLR